ncbi:hypothetical protein LWI28_027121 [Acer negundo]|uniref:Uncharacterized protein n=1 Tax=Acer negundo TaxID=4023 RepID=A0AAD5J1V6_ACENE|nr:hypothetical protein LWI28_027121 [Acer negundo]
MKVGEIREEIKVREVREEMKVGDTPTKKSKEENSGTGSVKKNDKISEKDLDGEILCKPVTLCDVQGVATSNWKMEESDADKNSSDPQADALTDSKMVEVHMVIKCLAVRHQIGIRAQGCSMFDFIISMAHRRRMLAIDEETAPQVNQRNLIKDDLRQQIHQLQQRLHLYENHDRE